MANILRLNNGKVVEVHYFAPERTDTLTLTIPAGSLSASQTIDTFTFNIDSPNNIVYFSGDIVFTAQVTTGALTYNVVFRILRDTTPILENPPILVTIVAATHEIIFSDIDEPGFNQCDYEREVTYSIVATATSTTIAPVADEIITFALPPELYPASILAAEIQI